MEPTVAERWSLVAASIVLIIGMMYVAINAANDGSQRAKLARGISTTPAPTIPVNGGFAIGKAEATPTPQPVSGGLPGIGQESSTGGGGGGGSSSGSGSATLDPGTAAAPKPGKYTYVTSNGTPITFVVEGRAGASGTRQREYFTDDKGQPAGQSDQNTWWKGDSKVVEDGKYSGGGQSTYCDWNPDLLQYPLPLNASSSWNVDSTCKVDLGPQGQGTLRSTGSSRVVGTERLQVGTKNVDCWVIEGSNTIVVSNATGQTIFTIQTTVKDWFAAKYGVSARVVTSGGPGGGGGGQSESTTLQSVDPK